MKPEYAYIAFAGAVLSWIIAFYFLVIKEGKNRKN